MTPTQNTLPIRKIQSAKLPNLLAKLISIPPNFIKSSVFTKTLNYILAPAIRNGDLEFLNHRVVIIKIEDAFLEFKMTLLNRKLVNASKWQPHDLMLAGNSYDFLLLASQKEDADTLFFERRLKMEGDTELSLEIKNFLDALEPSSMNLNKPIELGIQFSLNTFEKLFADNQKTV